jgi:hypothetical protein
MRIEFQRSGGVAGVRWPAVTIDTAALPEEEARGWQELVAATDFFNLPATSSPGNRRDPFSYRITVESEGRRHSIQTHGGGSSALQTLIERLERAGTGAS